jgi:(1->4)-alpha-D-glucan 1-alpha-D-glucosylmutase
LRKFVGLVLADQTLTGNVSAFVRRVETATTANSLAQKLVQLTMPGVPDIYQGCELVDRSLVDPDNRRPVDFGHRARLLAAGTDAKLRVVSTALRARRDHPQWFGATSAYAPLRADGRAADHLVGFVRGDGAVTLATRLSERLAGAGGWQETTVTLPSGSWTDLFSGRHVAGEQPLPVAELLHASPVTLLGRTPPSHS